MKNIADLCFGSLGWFACGWALAYGDTQPAGRWNMHFPCVGLLRELTLPVALHSCGVRASPPPPVLPKPQTLQSEPLARTLSVRSLCGAGAGCLAIHHQSLWQESTTWTLSARPSPSCREVAPRKIFKLVPLTSAIKQESTTPTRRTCLRCGARGSGASPLPLSP